MHEQRLLLKPQNKLFFVFVQFIPTFSIQAMAGGGDPKFRRLMIMQRKESLIEQEEMRMHTHAVAAANHQRGRLGDGDLGGDEGRLRTMKFDDQYSVSISLAVN